MRIILVLMAAASLAACDQKPAEAEKAAPAPKIAQISFDGAGYKDDISKVIHGERLSWVLGC